MVKPFEVVRTAQALERENIRFRTFLRNRADPEVLDAQFLQLHNELFAVYDCSQCRNCCKECGAVLEAEEIQAVSAFLGCSAQEFISDFLEETDEGYAVREKPCRFLCADGRCQIEACRPASCKDFPFTNRPERLFSLYGVLDCAYVCPVVLEILERLKPMYHFRDGRRGL